jgi:hypothetical protein
VKKPRRLIEGTVVISLTLRENRGQMQAWCVR